MHPIIEARRDYQGGTGFDGNPFSKNSPDYIKYQKEMNRLLTQELTDIRAELRAGV